MTSLADICAMLGAGALVGSGATVATQQITKPRRAIHKPARKPTPTARRVAPKPAPQSPAILDCPTPSLGGDFDSLSGIGADGWPPSTLSGSGFAAGLLASPPAMHGGGRGRYLSAPQPPDITPDGTAAVPEPDHWIMMITGFGIIGLAARRKVAAA